MFICDTGFMPPYYDNHQAEKESYLYCQANVHVEICVTFFECMCVLNLYWRLLVCVCECVCVCVCV